MTRHDFLFPEDLRNAIALRDTPLSFSMICQADVGPWTVPEMHPSDANAGGSVGIVVDVQDHDSVLTVGPDDDGTYFHPPTRDHISGGVPPSAKACARSIDERTSANEWFVQNFQVIGIFTFLPIYVRRAHFIPGMDGPIYAEAPIDLAEVLHAFAELRVFTTASARFLEYDRNSGTWAAREYGDIVTGSGI
ncbi:MAG: hypothetical protein WDO56_15915 [Gammaproteobacteria bacterium]